MQTVDCATFFEQFTGSHYTDKLGSVTNQDTLLFAAFNQLATFDIILGTIHSLKKDEGLTKNFLT